jgi:hypothetical protein
MYIERITSQHRRDFYCIYKCEHCDTTRDGSGYDDAHFHQNVVPTMICKNCGKTGDENYRPLTTKYPEGYQI